MAESLERRFTIPQWSDNPAHAESNGESCCGVYYFVVDHDAGTFEGICNECGRKIVLVADIREALKEVPGG